MHSLQHFICLHRKNAVSGCATCQIMHKGLAVVDTSSAIVSVISSSWSYTSSSSKSISCGSMSSYIILFCWKANLFALSYSSSRRTSTNLNLNHSTLLWFYDELLGSNGTNTPEFWLLEMCYVMPFTGQIRNLSWSLQVPY